MAVVEEAADDVVVSSGGAVVLVEVDIGASVDGPAAVVVEASAVVGGAGVEVESAESSEEQPSATRLITAPPNIRWRHGARIPTPTRRFGLRARSGESTSGGWRCSIAYTTPLSTAPAANRTPSVAMAIAGANGNPRPLVRR